ncbi:hypothetical protein [Rhodopirellula sp. P2]|uniref:hypothetical protein n=1 Tax=Rhodopirellula sp. P2 TaxID=2127060 RepID=UPI0023682263|nr:hypothetical protein [Rhodopirellula sp. P2]WDQ16380.1 hypothetical protein PSR62_22555 [Rhodopirellula sp. P2]
MTRAELVAAAERRLGCEVKRNQLDYALRCKYVRPASQRPDGWNFYDEASLDQLTAYMEQRSRTPRRELAS